MKRFLAILAALAMILVAVLIRGGIDGTNLFGRSGTKSAKGASLRLLCDNELQPVCQQLQDDNLATVTYSDPGRTVDDLVTGRAPEFDLWLRVGPWERILADNLRFASGNSNDSTTTRSPLGTPGPILGRSPVVLVALDKAAAEAIAASCPAGPGVSCATNQGSFKVGMTAPARGDGLVALSQSVSNRLAFQASAAGEEFAGFDANDLSDPELSSWIASLANTSRSAGLRNNQALDFALPRRGQFQAVAALEADAATSLGNRPNTTVLYPTPIVTADIRLIPRSGLKIDEVVDDSIIGRLKAELKNREWRVDDSVPAKPTNAPAIPASDGLPEPGVLQVLREVWGSGG